MKTPQQHRHGRNGWLLALVCTGAILCHGAANAQSSCASDGQRPPTELLERFINADCRTCWSDADTPVPQAGGIALDWILPGALGEEAPLSAAASRDATDRLGSLGKATPPSRLEHVQLAPNTAQQQASAAIDPQLRVARGIALNGYMGASIELRLPAAAGQPKGGFQYPLTAWLVLTESVPAGVEGSPVNRELVRNSLVATWTAPVAPASGLGKRPPAAQRRHFESRPMSLPAGANPDRISVVGWVQDARGRLLALARSVCST